MFQGVKRTPNGALLSNTALKPLQKPSQNVEEIMFLDKHTSVLDSHKSLDFSDTHFPCKVGRITSAFRVIEISTTSGRET